MLLRSAAQFDLALKLRSGQATIGEIYTFISGLYFRGKMAYSQAFASPPDGAPSALVITPGAGLMTPDTLITEDRLRSLATIDVDAEEPRYRQPLEIDARRLCESCDVDCEFVLLGSIATAKYMEPLLDCFGDRLVFPADFIGRGDMSRGGLMLRSAREGKELDYISALGANRRGKRPAKLPKLTTIERSKNQR